MSQPDWRRKATLEARQALGKLSPEKVWLLISFKVVDALELDPEESQQLAEGMHLFNQPDDPLELQDFEDVLEVVFGMDPVKGIAHFHYINPEVNLQAVDKAKPVDVLKAVLLIFTKSDLWAATH